VARAHSSEAPRKAGNQALSVGLILGVVFLLVGLVCLAAVGVPAWKDYRHDKQFATQSALALGMVLTKSRASAGQVTVLGTSKDVIEYSVRYRFKSADGRDIEATSKVSPDEWGSLDERGPIKVRYLPTEPEITHISGQQRSQSWIETLIFSLIGAGFVAIGGLTGFLVLKNGKPAR